MANRWERLVHYYNISHVCFISRERCHVGFDTSFSSYFFSKSWILVLFWCTGQCFKLTNLCLVHASWRSSWSVFPLHSVLASHTRRRWPPTWEDGLPHAKSSHCVFGPSNPLFLHPSISQSRGDMLSLNPVCYKKISHIFPSLCLIFMDTDGALAVTCLQKFLIFKLFFLPKVSSRYDYRQLVRFSKCYSTVSTYLEDDLLTLHNVKVSI